MDYEKAREVKALLEEFDRIDKEIGHIADQKENIGSEHSLILNCKNNNGMNINSVIIPAKDAKRILQFMQDFYVKEAARIMKKIEQIG